MEKFEYIVGVQIGRPRDPFEVSIEPREIIDEHTPSEDWFNKKGAEGWEFVVAIHPGGYT